MTTGEMTETIRRFSFDGPIGLSGAVTLGAFLAFLFAVLLWLERRATGRGWGTVFWVLRVAASALVLLMLLGPSWVTEHRTTRPQAIAILVDTSDSMTVIDPPESAAQRRWIRASAGDDGSGDALSCCERAVVAIRIASRRALEARAAVERHQSPQSLRLRIEEIAAAVERAVEHLEAGQEASSTDGDLTGRFERVLQVLEGRVVPQLCALEDTRGADAPDAAADVWETLHAIDDELAGAARRAEELARHLEREQDDAGSTAVVGPAGGRSRKEHVARTLDSVDRAAERSSESALSIRRVAFDRHAAPLPSEAGWTDLLLGGEINRGADDDSATTDRSATDLSAALDLLARTAAAESIRSAILISDGGHNEERARAPQEVAASLGGLPVHVVPIGRTEDVRDVILYRVDAPQVVVEEDTILIDVIVTAFRCAGEKSTVTLRRDGRTIDEQPLRFDRDRGDERIVFEVPAEELGRSQFELSVDPLADEASTTNNLAQISVDVVKDSLHILLADRIARWEYRYLDQLFRRDDTVTFDKLLFYPEPTATGALAAVGGLPRDVDAWADYDVVILGDLEPASLDERAQQTLDEYIRTRGGNLIVIAGNESMPHGYARQPLAGLLPVEPTRVSLPVQGAVLEVTSAGRAHPALAIADSPPESERVWREQFRSLPIHFLSEYSRPKATAETLIAVDPRDRAASLETTPDGTPAHCLLSWHRVGAGRVAYLASPATYRLRFRHGDIYHHRFWGQLLRWMTAAERSMGTQTVRIITDRIRYERGDTVDVTVRLFEPDGDPVADAALGASAVRGDGPVHEIELTADRKVPGRYFGSFNGLPAGGYRIVPTGETVGRLLPASSDREAAEVRITIAETESPELINTQCNQALLRQIAEVTGGQVVPPTAIGEVLDLSATAPEVNERVEREPLWDRWSLLGAAFACLCTEWIVRRRLGLV